MLHSIIYIEDLLFLRPSIVAKWRGLRGLVMPGERGLVQRARQREPRGACCRFHRRGSLAWLASAATVLGIDLITISRYASIRCGISKHELPQKPSYSKPSNRRHYITCTAPPETPALWLLREQAERIALLRRAGCLQRSPHFLGRPA